ncbi:MAG: TonB family protein [Longimicrobiales bacterium]
MSTTISSAAPRKVAPIRFQPMLPQPAHPGRSLLAWGVPAIILESAAAVLVIWVTAMGARVEPQPEETYHFVELTTEVSLPEPPPPPAAPQLLPSTPTVAPEVKGFQTLTVPTVILAEIPPPTLGQVTISAVDFTGQGIEGGRGGVEVVGEAAPPPVEAGPTFTPFTVAPYLKNGPAVARTLSREYPPTLRNAGIGAQVLLWLFIDERGRVQQTVVKTSSGFEQLDAAAMRVALTMEFSPALNRDRNVPVWVAVPVDFKVS